MFGWHVLSRFGRLEFGLVGLAAALTASTAGAQVNVEAVRSDADQQGLSGRVEASVSGRTGNTEGIIAGGSGRLQFRTGRHLTFLFGSGNYTRLNQTTSIARAMAHLRYNYEIEDWVWAEGYGQVENDKFRRLTNRELLGVGPRLGLFKSEAISLFYGTSYMAEWENLNLAESDRGSEETLSHRWNHYVTVSTTLDERLEAGTTTYFQPRFDKFSDYRIMNETYIEVGITDVISTKVSTWMRRDSKPPSEVKKTDFLIANSFVAKF